MLLSSAPAPPAPPRALAMAEADAVSPLPRVTHAHRGSSRRDGAASLYKRSQSMAAPSASAAQSSDDLSILEATGPPAPAAMSPAAAQGALPQVGQPPAPALERPANDALESVRTQPMTQPNAAVVRARDRRELVSREEVPPLRLLEYLLGEVDNSKPSRGPHAAGATGGLKERERVYNTLLYVPWQLERLLAFGLIMCCDACLGLFTFLPWRLVRVVRRVLSAGPLSLKRLVFPPSAGEGAAAPVLQPEQVVDVFWATIVVSGVVFVNQFDVSVIYHYIRGQEMVKLYLVYTMLEILDKICCSFGADALEALAGTTERLMAGGGGGEHGGGGGVAPDSPKRGGHSELVRPPMWYLVSDFAVALVLVNLHATILLTQAITFNVAINSHNNALLALLISNNFAEVKGIIFKRMDVTKLWSMACQDMTERFHIFVCVVFVAMEMALRTGFHLAQVDKVVSLGLTIFAAEVLVDVIKHSVLGKFNQIRPGVYSEFLKDICQHASLCPGSNQIHRGVMFNPLSPAVVFIRALWPLGAFAYRRVRKASVSGGAAAAASMAWRHFGYGVAGYAALCLVKLALGVFIQVLARQYLRHFFGKRDKSTAGGMAGAATALKKVA